MENQETEASQPEVTEEPSRAAEDLETTEVSEGTAPEETTEEVPPTESEAKKDEVNALKSWVGRRDTAIEAKIAANNAEILAKLDALTPPATPDGDEFSDDTYMTKSQVTQFMADSKKQEEAVANKYKDDYSAALSSMGADMPDEEYNTVIAEHFANHNERLSNDPKRDAEVNFLRASNALFRKGGKVNPLGGKPPTGPLGTGGGTKVEAKPAVMPKLDSMAESFIKSQGKDAAWVKEALGEK